MGICKIGKKEKTRKSVCRLDLRVRLMVTRTGIELNKHILVNYQKLQ